MIYRVHIQGVEPIPHRLSDTTIEIIRRYIGGEKACSIAKGLGVTRQNVSRAVKTYIPGIREERKNAEKKKRENIQRARNIVVAVHEDASNDLEETCFGGPCCCCSLAKSCLGELFDVIKEVRDD